ncbi:pilus assembly protein TadG-related protein [Streptomyces sp. NPDC014894]|uniref:pilus assembly protein TadG-related protein n=1 Tax=Streptomyces sp. NPDC014894 TaxID=3364931 RepID=UPI003700E065
MTAAFRRSDAGQAAPIYAAMVVGLLFLALAFFAVGQAGATRNGAQSGADAAALAAAQESRDSLGEELEAGILDPDFLRDFLGGGARDAAGPGCAEADRLAGVNGALVTGCTVLADARWGYAVTVESREPVGDTVLPGTENDYATASATAVVEPRCTFEQAPEEPLPGDGGDGGEGEESGGQEGEPEPGPTESEPAPTEPEEPVSPGTLHCDGESIDIDPQQPDRLPDMSDLFTVRLDGD